VLIHAAREGHADCVRLLLDAGADKNAQDTVRNRVVASLGVCKSRVRLCDGDDSVSGDALFDV
jgi:ankyrin repeat protein